MLDVYDEDDIRLTPEERMVKRMRPEEARAYWHNKLLNHVKEKRLMKAEEIRSSIDIEACINSLLLLGEQSRSCDIEDLERLKFQASIYTTVLRKALPDLKALEIKEKPNNFSKLIIDYGHTPSDESNL